MSKVLIVEPDNEERESIATTMLKQGWQILKAATAKEALIYFKNNKVDLLLTNTMIPLRFDGINFVKKIRELDKEVYVVMITGDRDPHSVINYLKSGSNDYMIKPFDQDILLWKLKFKFNSINTREFAKVHISESDETACVLDIKGAVIGIGEDFIDLFFPYKVEKGAKIQMSSMFFENLGLGKQSLMLEVLDTQKMPITIHKYPFVISCKFIKDSAVDYDFILKTVPIVCRVMGSEVEKAITEKYLGVLVKKFEERVNIYKTSSENFSKERFLRTLFRFQGHITEIHEAGFSLKSPVKLTDVLSLNMKSKLFYKIGFNPPSSILSPATSGSGDVCEGSFIGITEDNATQIRAWINKELTK